MRKLPLRLCKYMLLSIFMANAYTLASNYNDEIIYKYQYNKVPIKNPIVTASMRPAVIKYNGGNYLGAMLDLEKLIKKETDNTYAKYYLALSYAQLGYKDKAEGMYKDVVDNGNSYALAYYSKRALVCPENPDDEICLPPKQVLAPQPRPKPSSANKTADEEEMDDMARFIRSGKSIHPAAMDRITKERMERKIQADEYSRKKREQEAMEEEARRQNAQSEPAVAQEVNAEEQPKKPRRPKAYKEKQQNQGQE